jgi:hypothetical protein
MVRVGAEIPIGSRVPDGVKGACHCILLAHQLEGYLAMRSIVRGGVFLGLSCIPPELLAVVPFQDVPIDQTSHRPSQE